MSNRRLKTKAVLRSEAAETEAASPLARYRNPWHKKNERGGTEFFETDAEPVQHAGCLIYERIPGQCWDVVYDGVCLTQRAGPRGAREGADAAAANGYYAELRARATTASQRKIASRFVERRYKDGEIDWLWVRNTRPGDVDCTDLSEDELAARITDARAGRRSPIEAGAAAINGAHARFIIVSVHEKTGRVTALPMEPEPHHEATVMLKRFSPHPLRRVQLHDASQPIPEFLPRTLR